LCEAVIRQRCRSCGSEVRCRAYETILQGRLQWVIWCRCETCGDEGAEEFGWDETPAEVRKALLDQCGVFRLRAQPVRDFPRVPVMKLFRADGATVADVSATVDALLTTGLLGTEMEMELIKMRLATVGVQAAYTRDDLGGAT
jgi:hypothetical protein